VEACLTAALSHDRGERSHWTSRGFARMKRGQWTAGDPIPDWRAAESDYAEALRISPGWAFALEGRGTCLARIAERTREGAADAEFYLAEAVQRKPRVSSAWYWRGVAALARGEHARAVEWFDECLKLDPSNAQAASKRAESQKGIPK
jgi:tetratricopeptide (TPR) repeat protein